MKKLFYIILFSLFLVSCAEKSYFIDGNSSQFALNGGSMAYIRDFSSATIRSIDSCEVLHGHFQMSGPLDSVMFVSLFMGNDNFIPIVLENGDININIANTTVKIEGTPLNDRLYSFLESRDSLVYLLNDLPRSQAYLFLQGYSPFGIQRALFAKEAEYKKALEELETRFIKDNYDNVLGVSWFMELCYRNQDIYGIPILTPQLQQIYKDAPRRFRKNYKVSSFMNTIRSY